MLRQDLKHQVNMEIAASVAKLSTCQFTQVGSVLVEPKTNRIISTGYNGTIPGQPHCDVRFFENRDEHKEWSDENEIHAETNSLLNAAKNGQTTEGSYLYTTIAPCSNCAKHLAAAGVKKVFFKEYYWRTGEKLFNTNSLEYQKL